MEQHLEKERTQAGEDLRRVHAKAREAERALTEEKDKLAIQLQRAREDAGREKEARRAAATEAQTLRQKEEEARRKVLTLQAQVQQSGEEAAESRRKANLLRDECALLRSKLVEAGAGQDAACERERTAAARVVENEKSIRDVGKALQDTQRELEETKSAFSQLQEALRETQERAISSADAVSSLKALLAESEDDNTTLREALRDAAAALTVFQRKQSHPTSLGFQPMPQMAVHEDSRDTHTGLGRPIALPTEEDFVDEDGEGEAGDHTHVQVTASAGERQPVLRARKRETRPSTVSDSQPPPRSPGRVIRVGARVTRTKSPVRQQRTPPHPRGGTGTAASSLVAELGRERERIKQQLDRLAGRQDGRSRVLSAVEGRGSPATML